MEIAIIVAIVLLNLIVHELAHAVAMARNGVRIKEIGLGIRLPLIPCVIFKSTEKRPAFVLSPLLIGAYVEPYDKGSIEKLPSYIKKAEIYSAGILANIIFGGVLLIFGHFLFSEISIKTGIFVGIILILIFARKQISAIMPVLGLAMLGLTVWSLFSFGLKNSLAGPIGIAQVAGGYSKTIEDAIMFGVIFSFAIAATNMLPLVPLDGGKATEALLYRLFGPKKWIRLVSRIGIALFICLIVLAFSSDIARILF